MSKHCDVQVFYKPPAWKGAGIIVKVDEAMKMNITRRYYINKRRELT